MRRRFLVPLLVAVAALAPSALGASDPLQLRAQEVRYAIPATAGYVADHGTYAGMTLTKLRRYDRKIKNIAVRRATKRSFCIHSTKRPFVHLNGPAGVARTGRCGVRGAEVPRPGERPAPPPPSTPAEHVRYAVPAVEAYGADNGGYAGMTVEGLRYWDKSITDLRVAWSTRDSYCIESGSGSEAYHKAGPGASVSPGPCPAPPS